MLIFDELKKDDPQLRTLAGVVLCGMVILLAGLWWVQLISSRHFQEKLETQSIRTVRIPAVRGKIMDREGRTLAENRPSYNVNLYVEELSKNFQASYSNRVSMVKKTLAGLREEKQKQLGRKLTPAEAKPYALTEAIRSALQRRCRYEICSGIVSDLSSRLAEPITLDEKLFQDKYDKARALPIPVAANLTPSQLARFEEQSGSIPGLDLEVQSMRCYPNGPVAAHLLGYLVRNNESSDEEIADYNYRLIDFVGRVGIEGRFDRELRGTAGEKYVVVNYLGYRQSESIFSQAEPGQNVVLTIDLEIQKVAEAALQKAQANVRGAVVVMDAQNGDILAMASAPSFDPGHRIRPDPATKKTEDERWTDESLGLQRNRATYENYHPGSIFKIVVAMAGLETGAINPKEVYHSDGYFQLGKRHIGDTAGPGDFDFDRALAKSSNPYFIHNGLKPGVIEKVVALGQHLHLGEKTDIMPSQETRGNFPTPKRINDSEWRDGDTANLSIGQGEIDVTPVQMAVMASAVANGGTVYWPRLVASVENANGNGPIDAKTAGRIRDRLGVSSKTLRTVHEAMLRDTESSEGTGHGVVVPGWRIAGKTGTAEVEKYGRIDKSAKDTWFLSFGPYSGDYKSRYVVVATVEGGASGGKTCVPIVHEVYLALQAREQRLEQQKVNGGRTLATAQ
jgi:penicillin-binding protein 2